MVYRDEIILFFKGKGEGIIWRYILMVKKTFEGNSEIREEEL